MSATSSDVRIAPLDSASLAPPFIHALTRVRVRSIDILRGIVIALMALDHVRDFFGGLTVNPLDLEHTTPIVFFTRWITHFCAPVFIFLAGVSAYRVSCRCTRAELSRFLLTRGAWLIVVEFTLVNFALNFNLRYEFGLLMQVIWAIGVSMMVLAALVHLPVRIIGAIALIMIAGHNLLDGIEPEQLGAWAALWKVLHVQSMAPFGIVHYPLIPWVGVMALGYVMGTLYDLEPERRKQVLIMLGSTAIALFVLLRLANVYGDPQPWTPQSSFLFTLMSFLNVEKYPPSLLYLLITLGPALIALAVLESAHGWLAGVLDTFGRVPLFFYVLHMMLAHLAAGVTAWAVGFGTTVLTGFFIAFPPQWGISLPMVYVTWLMVLVVLYPACRWFSELKRRRTDWWLSYL